jgi:O-antigen ligase
VLLGIVAWSASPQLRTKLSLFFADYYHYSVQNNPTGVGSRLEFWQKSLRFFAAAPVIGHGTGIHTGSV